MKLSITLEDYNNTVIAYTDVKQPIKGPLTQAQKHAISILNLLASNGIQLIGVEGKKIEKEGNVINVPEERWRKK